MKTLVSIISNSRKQTGSYFICRIEYRNILWKHLNQISLKLIELSTL